MTATLLVDTGKLVFTPEEPQEIGLGKTFNIDFNRQGAYAHSSKDDVVVNVYEADGSIVGIHGKAKLKHDHVKVHVAKFDDDDTVGEGEEFKYNIEVEGVGLLDPRIRVIENISLAQQTWNIFETFLLDELGISLADRDEAVRQLEEYIRSAPDYNSAK